MCHSLGIAIPLGGVLLDGDEPRLNIMYVVAKMLMQCKGNGCEYFVVLHIPSPLS